jgi:hypothetical protein
MNVTRSCASLLLVSGLALGLVACEDDSPSAKAQEMTAPIKEALKSPTGKMDAASAPKVFQNLTSGSAAGSAASFAVGIPAPAPQGVGPYGSCVDGTGEEGEPITMDLGCMTGGLMTGTIVTTTEIEDDVTYSILEYQDVCDSAATACVDGTAATEMSGTPPASFEMIMAGDFTVTAGGVTEDFQYGVQMAFDGASYAYSWVVFVDGQSYVVTLSLDSTTGAGGYSVKSANGTWECTFTEGGAHGECTGAEALTW